MPASGILIPLVWIAIWTSTTVAFDAILVRRAVAQEAARFYPRVAGRVIESRVELTDGEDAVHRPLVRFSYEASGQHREATTLSFHEIGSSDAGWARRVVASYPPGHAVAVHVDPADATRAILEPGLSGMDLLMALFLLPFNIVMLGSWSWAYQLATSDRPRVAGGAAVLEDDAGLRVRLPPFEALHAAGIALGGASFLAIFGVAFTLGMHPSIGAMSLVVAAVVGVTLLVYLPMRSREAKGEFDLVVSRATATVRLPAVLGRATPLTESRANVRGAVTVRHDIVDSDGDTEARWRTCVMVGQPGHEQPRPIAEWTSERRAAELTDWLQERLKQV